MEEWKSSCWMPVRSREHHGRGSRSLNAEEKNLRDVWRLKWVEYNLCVVGHKTSIKTYFFDIFHLISAGEVWATEAANGGREFTGKWRDSPGNVDDTLFSFNKQTDCFSIIFLFYYISILSILRWQFCHNNLVILLSPLTMVLTECFKVFMICVCLVKFEHFKRTAYLLCIANISVIVNMLRTFMYFVLLRKEC